MKQINISVSFDDEKLRALNKYLKKKELTAVFENTPQKNLPGGAAMQWVELGAYEAN